MTDRVLERSQIVPVGVDEAFAFFADPWNLEPITPPRLRFQIMEAPAALKRGSRCSPTNYGYSGCRSAGALARIPNGYPSPILDPT